MVSFSADENVVKTTNDTSTTPDTQIQKQRKSKYYNNVFIYSYQTIYCIISCNVLHFVIGMVFW